MTIHHALAWAAVPVPCWTIVCDVCGHNPAESDEYAGMGPTASDAREHYCSWDETPWHTVADTLDICPEHAEWSHDDDPDHRPCQSCGTYPRDELLWAGNCPDCWAQAIGADR